MFFLGDGDAGQRQAAAVAGVELHIDEHDLAQVLEHLPGGKAWCLLRGEFLQAHVHGVAKERDHDVRLHPVSELVPEGAHFDLALHGAEGGFGFG